MSWWGKTVGDECAVLGRVCRPGRTCGTWQSLSLLTGLALRTLIRTRLPNFQQHLSLLISPFPFSHSFAHLDFGSLHFSPQKSEVWTGTFHWLASALDIGALGGGQPRVSETQRLQPRADSAQCDSFCVQHLDFALLRVFWGFPNNLISWVLLI